jgi:hypothetical protein
MPFKMEGWGNPNSVDVTKSVITPGSLDSLRWRIKFVNPFCPPETMDALDNLFLWACL